MSSLPDESAIKAALKPLQDPETGRSVVAMDQVQDISADDNGINVSLALTTYSAPLWDKVIADAESLLKKSFPDVAVKVNRTLMERPAEKIGEIGLTAKSVIAVGSGKGGVGKSTVAASIAYGATGVVGVII